MTFTARQQIVNHYYKQNVRVQNSWLGEINYLPRFVSFTFFKATDRWGSRVFFFYTNPDFDMANSIDTQRMTVKKLRENWYFIQVPMRAE